MGWAKNISCMWEIRNAFKIFVEILEDMRPPRKFRSRQEDDPSLREGCGMDSTGTE
jgi:hypothetical protein